MIVVIGDGSDRLITRDVVVMMVGSDGYDR